MWCPTCRSEYRDGVTTCADCGASLVASAVTGAPDERRDDEHALTNDDVLVEVERVAAVRGEIMVAWLRDAGVPAITIGPGTYTSTLPFTEGVRVMVRHADRERARAVLRDFERNAHDAPFTDEELAELAEHAVPDADPDDGAVV